MSDFVTQEEIGIGALPERFLRFCRFSIENKRGECLYTDPHISDQPAPSNYDGECSALEFGSVDDNEIIRLAPIPSNRLVAAIDTSTIRLGELEDGSLCALRGAVVTLEGKHYKYTRYGPLVFSLGNSLNINQIPELGIASFAGASNVEILLRRVRNSLERWLQLSVTRALSDALILIDGSLTAGTPDNPPAEMEHLLEIARRSENLVIAISKNTQLRIHDKSITALLEQNSEPCLLDVDKRIRRQFPAHQIQFLGRVFVGKLARLGFPFRIDIDRKVATEQSVTGIRQLTGTDIVDQGYPETLRVAHILSTFTAGDVLAIQSLAASRFGIQLLPKFALRRSLFGPFGTGWETRH
jgi:hypothetical protein